MTRRELNIEQLSIKLGEFAGEFTLNDIPLVAWDCKLCWKIKILTLTCEGNRNKIQYRNMSVSKDFFMISMHFNCSRL